MALPAKNIYPVLLGKFNQGKSNPKKLMDFFESKFR